LCTIFYKDMTSMTNMINMTTTILKVRKKLWLR
jgi:hypothetical protein